MGQDTMHSELTVPVRQRSHPSRRATPEAMRAPLVEVLRKGPAYTTVAVASDVIACVLALMITQWWSAWSDDAELFASTTWYPWLFIPFVVALLASRGMYQPRLNRSVIDELLPIVGAVGLATLLMLTTMLTFSHAERPGVTSVRIWICACALIPVARLIRSLVNRMMRRRYRLGARTLIVGTDPIALQLAARLQQLPEYGLRPIGLMDGTAANLLSDDLALTQLPFLGNPDDLIDVAKRTHAEEVIIAVPSATDDELARVAKAAHQHGLEVRVVPRLMDAMGVGARVEHVGGLPLLVLCYTNPKGWQFALKHAIDVVAASVGLLLISPLFLALAAAVKLSSPGPIFYGQERVGRDGKVFACLKFRSMRPPTAADLEFERKEGDAPGGVEGTDRRTRIGKLMRKTSLDELPQLINVLRGEMSLVGPRPERPEFVELFDMQIRRYGERHRVRAGMTGWAQVHGLRGQTSIADRAEFDNYYIENWSLSLDLKILLLTVLAVLRPSED